MKCSCHSHGSFLTAVGLAEAAQRELEFDGVDNLDAMCYLDKSGSVSALIEIEDDSEYDPDHVQLNRRLIHNGS